MNEYKAIEVADSLKPLDKLRYYMEYFINCLPSKASISFEQFCSPKNIIKHDVGEDWKEYGFASQCWVNLSGGSIYHSVYHNLISDSLRSNYYVKNVKAVRIHYPNFKPNQTPPIMFFATAENGKDIWDNFGLLTPTDIARNSDGTPKQVKPEYQWHEQNANLPSPAAGTPVTITITKDNHE